MTGMMEHKRSILFILESNSNLYANSLAEVQTSSHYESFEFTSREMYHFTSEFLGQQLREYNDSTHPATLEKIALI